MMLGRRRYTREFKMELLKRLERGERITTLAREHQLHPQVIARWRREFRTAPETAFTGQAAGGATERRLALLERTIGQLTMENTLLKKALQRLAAPRAVRARRRRS